MTAQKISVGGHLDSIRDMPPKIPVSILKQATLLKSPHSPHNLYLIGTNHTSKTSADSVRELIDTVKPEVVIFELCRRRESLLQPSEIVKVFPTPAYQKAKDIWTGEMNPFVYLCGQYQHDESARQGSTGGAEFEAGFKAARLCGAHIVLGDRDQGITMQRLWNGLTPYEKLRHTFQQRFPSFQRFSSSGRDVAYENCEENSVTDAMLDIGQEFPWIIESMIFERDLYMLYVFTTIMKGLDNTKEGNMVAVVGKAHIASLVQRWENEIKFPGSELNMKGMEDIVRVPGDKSHPDYISVRDLR